MRLVVGIEQRLTRLPNGTIWTQGISSYEYWQKHSLETFDEILIVARVKDELCVPEKWVRVDGNRVSVKAAPHYIGPKQYVRRALSMHRDLRAVVRADDALIVKAPGQIARTLVDSRRNGPYGVEVVGDPWDAFSPGAIVHPLRAVFRRYFRRQLRHICRGASCVAYVTQSALQSRYPGGPQTETFQVTDGVDEVRSTFTSLGDPSNAVVIFVGSLAQMYKAPDILLRAIAICTSRFGLPLRLIMVGDGKHRQELEHLASSLDIRGQVEFTGELPSGAAVRDRLDMANLFVLPSRTEGLPRAMIEAMARGLPCIGTDVGGIPELLDKDELVEPGNAEALAKKINAIVSHPERMKALSTRNLAVAGEYLNLNLHPQRTSFHRSVLAKTEAWIQGQAHA